MTRRQLQRMARRMVRRAHIEGESGVAVSFGFTSLWAAIVVGVLAEIPYISLAVTLLAFPLHRIVLVTDKYVYVFRDWPFHMPGEMLGKYPVGPEAVTRVRGKLTFPDGRFVWHSPIFTFRARWVAEAATKGQPG